MENTNVVNDTVRAVVAPENNGGESAGTPASDTKAELTDRTQSASDNSHFRKLRLENERYKRELEGFKDKLKGLDELEKLKAENKRYLDKLVKDKMDADLEAIRRIDPRIETLSGIGDEFVRLVENGVDVMVAFNAVRQSADGKEIPAPPSIGAVGTTEDKSRFYTSKELDRLTARDLENPSVYKKAIESLKRL